MSEPTIITASKVTVYRVNGKGKGWRTKPAAYRSAAISLVQAACECDYDDHPYGDGTMTEHHVCRLCTRDCEGRAKHDYSHIRRDDPSVDATDFECADPTHSYRYRLIGRLARWLRWRDERAKKGKVT